MRIVITGATGNVGTSLLQRLGGDEHEGEHELVAVSRRRPPAAPPYSWAQWHRLDIGIADAQARLTHLFEGADAVVHLAFALQPFGDRAAMRRTNQDGTAAVTGAVIAAGVPHFVHQSSVGAYGPGPKSPVDESWPTTGIATSTYSVDKAAAEDIVTAAEPHAVVTRMRPALIFQNAAASEVARYFLGRFVPKVAVRRPVLRFAPFTDSMSFQVVHSDDVAGALDLVLRERAGGAFNVAAEPVVDRATFAAVFGGVGPALPPALLRMGANLTHKARLQPTEPGWLDLAVHSPLLDTGRLRELGWTPQHSADDVLGRFVDAIARGDGRAGPLLHHRVATGRDHPRDA
ncbi:NAD-dependent epimerase/dehydratase family protein [uncultured Jatrophihabitans sp.]|uniref:NAD-dependent epimerase/dehydratase family protein n=1 Tax=uncultured Jatrophihabitans sp. TaxID=1610747 RepID=UPI0035CC787D